MAIKDIKQMTRSLSNKGEKEVAMSDPHPDAERFDMMDMMSEKYFGKPYDKLTPKEIIELEENWDELISKRKEPEGIMKVAMSDETDRIEKAAMTWFIDTYGQEGLDSFLEGGTDMGSIINEYLQFRFYEMN